MQEVKSTEVLDNEIQNEARQKVVAILEKADAECKKILDDVDLHVKESIEEKSKTFNKRLNQVQKNFEATIPLERKRFEVLFVQNSIIQKINDYLKSLSVEKRMSLVFDYLKIDFSKLASCKLNAYVYGFDEKSVQTYLEKKLGLSVLKTEKTEFGKYVPEDDIGLELKEGIILEAEDKSVRCRLTLTEVITHLLDENRSQLARALFGSGVLEEV